MGKVTELRPKATADDILEALQGQLDSVLVVGWNKDGIMVITSNEPDGDVMLMMEIARVSIVEAHISEYDG
jgi:hypothetical protein